LENAGIIIGYSARLDEAALGCPISVFVSIQLDRQIDNRLASFEEEMSAFEEVIDCWLMTGNRDYLMRVVTANL